MTASPPTISACARLLLALVVLLPQIEALAEESFRELPGSRTDITSTINARTQQIRHDERLSHAQLLQRYQATLRRLKTRLPVIRPQPEAVLHSYHGLSAVEEPETFSAPYMLVVPQNFDGKAIRVETFTADTAGRRIPGLRVKSRLPAHVRKLPFNALSELYVSDLNARAAGFKYGQLKQNFSKNVVPAPVFDYNGIREWSAHQRYNAYDQVSRPIELSNFAHVVGNTYVLSPHPDFALEFKNYRTEEVVLTFFLWHELPGNQQAPDLVYQLVLAAP